MLAFQYRDMVLETGLTLRARLSVTGEDPSTPCFEYRLDKATRTSGDFLYNNMSHVYSIT